MLQSKQGMCHGVRIDGRINMQHFVLRQLSFRITVPAERHAQEVESPLNKLKLLL
jgi:hypothetical protein